MPYSPRQMAPRVRSWRGLFAQARMSAVGLDYAMLDKAYFGGASLDEAQEDTT